MSDMPPELLAMSSGWFSYEVRHAWRRVRGNPLWLVPMLPFVILLMPVAALYRCLDVLADSIMGDG